jgi:hypothetical protein
MKAIDRGHVVALLMLLIPIWSQAESGVPVVSGSLEAAGLCGLARDAGAGGFSSELRLVLELSPEDGMLFRAEGGYTLDYGLASELAIVYDAGAAAPADPADLPPGDDLHRGFFLDQAYAQATLGRVSMRAGIVPVGWGSAYLYNPTSRTAESEFPGENLDIVRGRAGFWTSLALPRSVSLEAYALADGRAHSTVPDIGELDADAVPWGVKAQVRTNAIDASVSCFRELRRAGEDATLWLGADIALITGDVTWYAEAAIPPEDSESLEGSVGLSYLPPIDGTTLRAEYIYLGAGATDAQDYDDAALIDGDRVLLGRQYLFLGAEIEDVQAARWKLEAGCLMNLVDRSAVLLAEATWIPRLSLELSCFARWFTGSGEEELGGERPLGPSISLAPYRSAAGLSVKMRF